MNIEPDRQREREREREQSAVAFAMAAAVAASAGRRIRFIISRGGSTQSAAHSKHLLQQRRRHIALLNTPTPCRLLRLHARDRVCYKELCSVFSSGRPSNLSVSAYRVIGHFFLFRHCIGLPKCRNFGISADTTEISAEIEKSTIGFGVSAKNLYRSTPSFQPFH